MIDMIIKRDGRQVPFNEEKISAAITKAFQASGSAKGASVAAELARQVVSRINADEHIGTPTVEEVQDIVERVLLDNGFVTTAKSYIVYRAERSRVRQMNTRLMRIYDDITNKAARDSDIKRENANINGDTAMGAMLKYGSEGAKQFNTMFVLKPEHAAAHNNGDIHIHDMDFYTLTTTCTQIDLVRLFEGGFSTGHGVLKEPNDISSYSALACIAIQANQNDQHGGQSVPNFDYAMAVGVRKTFAKRYRDNMVRALELKEYMEDATEPVKAYMKELEKDGLKPTLVFNEAYAEAEKAELIKLGVNEAEIDNLQQFAQQKAEKETDRATYQAMEALIHNLNTMNSRAGAQVPFSSINYGTDTSAEARLVMKNLLLATEAGLGHGETPIFPIQIFRVKEGINYNPGEPNYDLFKLAIRVSAKRLFPNFSFQDAPYNLQYYKPGHPETEIAYMGCRTRVVGNVYDPSRQITYSRGNLSFTSINLPRIAINAKEDLDWFFNDLDRKIDLVIEQLLARFKLQSGKHVRNYQFLMGEGVWLDSDKLG
ncbi:MAG: anaerobic ribonucleoside triphosphate reductase, partial [Clostridia bacterium]|nr:anaerobic ribonucleoside triphosphate reductase [Clostridia bacterium]